MRTSRNLPKYTERTTGCIGSRTDPSINTGMNSLREYINLIERMSAEQHRNVKVKGGMIPFVIDNGNLKMMFAISSDPAYGGPNPGIAKGHLDPNEDFLRGATREAEEELGLKSSNFAGQPFLVAAQKITGLAAAYMLHVFAVQVKSQTDFNPHDYEVGGVKWMTLDEYKRSGRRSQLAFVQALANKLKMG